MATRRGLLAAGAAGVTGCLGARPRREVAPLDAGAAGTRVGFVGDVMLGRGVNDRFVGGDPTDVWGSTLERLRGLDGLVANLECCVSDRGERWPGKTYYFRADPSFAVPALRAAGATVVSLANNHVLDYGRTALRDTRRHLGRAAVAHAGAGPDLEAALVPAVRSVGGLTVAVVAFTDRYEPYAASPAGPGTAHSQLHPAVDRTRRLVRRALDRARSHDPDLVVASLHWGPNWDTAPARSQVAFARWLVDRGVDVVHGHSAHVLQGVEVYRGRPILYDAGDFVDDYVHRDDVYNKRSALFELVVSDGDLRALRVVPVEIHRDAASVADDEAAAWVRGALRRRSRPFGTSLEPAGEGLRVGL